MIDLFLIENPNTMASYSDYCGLSSKQLEYDAYQEVA
jgi:hypothetical protein